MRVLILLLIFVAGPAIAGPKLYVFDCGSINLADLALYGLSEDESEVRELSVPCYLIEHSGGRLLWEGGLPRAVVSTGQPVTLQGAILRYKRWVGDQLADMGVLPADITHVAVSHLHFDHTGAAASFPASTVLMRREELQAATGDEYAFGDSEAIQALQSSRLEFIEGDYDVFGDGSVMLIPAPGHTPGHQVMLVNLDNAGAVLLVGDLYHTKANRELRRPPVFNSDGDQTLASMEKVEQLLQDTGASIWIEHDRAQTAKLKKAPAYYD